MHCSKATHLREGGENASLRRRKAESPLLYGSEGSVHGWQEYMQAYAGPRGAEMEWELRGLIMAVSKMK